MAKAISGQEVRLRTLEREIAEVKADVKEVLKTVQAQAVQLASLPSNERVEALEKRTSENEKAIERASGGLKVLVTVGSLAGSLLGWIGGLIFGK
jgi:hypothetical protein